MKVAVAILCSTVVLFAAYLFFMPLVEPKEPRRKNKAQGQVEDLASMVYLESDKARINSLLDGKHGSVELKNEQVFEAISTRNKRVVDRLDTDWAKLQRFTDPWGHDYLFLFESRTNRQEKLVWNVKVRTIGANGINEAGKGDDITSRTLELEE